MKLEIKELIGPRCIVKEDGQVIFETIHPAIKSGQVVILDFKGVSQFASPFFNLAIGQLFVDIAEADIKRFLHLENLNDTGQMVVERVIENSVHYQVDTDYRKIVDAILEQQAKESD